MERDADFISQNAFGGKHNSGVHSKPNHRAERRDGGALEHDDAEHRAPPRAKRAQDGKLAAAFVHRVIYTCQHGARRHHGHEQCHPTQYFLRPTEPVEQPRHDVGGGFHEGQVIGAFIVNAVEAVHPEGARGGVRAHLNQYRAHIAGVLRVVTVHLLQALDGNPNHVIGGRAGGAQDAHHGVLILMRLLAFGKIKAVVGAELLVHAPAEFTRHRVTDHGFLVPLLIVANKIIAHRQRVGFSRRMLGGK